MRRSLPRHAFDTARHLINLHELRIFQQFGLKPGIAVIFVSQTAVTVRQHLSQLRQFDFGHAKSFTRIAQGLAFAKSRKGHYLRHMIAAIASFHVGQQFRAAVIRHIDVNIGHGHALRIEETLKKQMIGHWIHVRDLQSESYQRTRRRTTSHAAVNSLLPRITQQIRHNQEIIVKAHLMNHGQLMLQLLLISQICQIQCCQP